MAKFIELSAEETIDVSEILRQQEEPEKSDRDKKEDD